MSTEATAVNIAPVTPPTGPVAGTEATTWRAGTIYLNVFSAEPSLTNYLPSSKPAHGDETDRSFLKQPTSVHSTNEHTWKVHSGTLRQKLDVFCLQTAPSP